MFCSGCKRRVAFCECQAKNQLKKDWPTGTWFQKRLKKVLIAQTNGHEPEKESSRDAGYSLLEVALFLFVFASIVVALVTYAYIGRQAIENLQAVGRCIQALLECTHI